MKTRKGGKFGGIKRKEDMRKAGSREEKERAGWENLAILTVAASFSLGNVVRRKFSSSFEALWVKIFYL